MTTVCENLQKCAIIEEDGIDVTRMLVGCMFYPFQAHNPLTPPVLDCRPEEVLSSAVSLALRLLRACIDSYIARSCSPLLAPISVGLLWLEHNTNIITLRSGATLEARQFTESLSKLARIIPKGPASLGSPPLQEDIDLNGFLPLMGHFESVNYSLPSISDAAAVTLRRTARVFNLFVPRYLSPCFLFVVASLLLIQRAIPALQTLRRIYRGQRKGSVSSLPEELLPRPVTHHLFLVKQINRRWLD
jgi:hypothetical protein